MDDKTTSNKRFVKVEKKKMEPYDREKHKTG